MRTLQLGRTVRPLRPRGGTDRHRRGVTLTHMETEYEFQEPTNIHPDGTPEWELADDEALHVVVRDGSILLGGRALHPLVAKQLADNLGGALVYLVNQQEGE